MSFLNEAFPLPDFTNKINDKKSIILPKDLESYKNKEFLVIPINQPFAKGEYHVNHFVCFFEKSTDWDYLGETQKLFSYFPAYFNNDLTKVSIHKKNWNKHKIASFDITHSPINPHKDIVKLEQYSDQKDTVVGTTLYDNREQGYLESALEGLALLNSGMNNNVHFLSGRRSWKFGKVYPDNPTSNLHYFETAALERFSLEFYHNLDKNKNPPPIRTLVNNTWVAMLKKFGKIGDVDLIEMSKDENNPVYPFDGMQGYNKDVRKISNKECTVYFRNGSSKTLNGLSGDESWFTNVQDRHQSLRFQNMPIIGD
ncbi:MAG: hypothetical protein JXR05_12280 [Flavobacteriaceae bacterium]